MIAPQFVVLVAILLPTLIYILLAVRENRRGLSISTFFPLSRFIPSGEYGRSTAAAGISLATVVLALVNLAPILGVGLFVTVASYVAGFAALYLVAPAILRANPDNRTLQAYLGRAYGSLSVKYCALGFSFVGYVSIFAMELIVGVTVLEPFFPDSVLLTATLFLVFIVAYSTIGGFRAIVATEQWQIRFVLIAVGSLALLAAWLWWEWRPAPLATIASTVFSSWHAGWAFCFGIIAMNIPAAISDAGTWQRLCATRSEADARQGLRHAMILFAMIWGTLIVASCFIAVTAQAAGQFDPATQSLMTFVTGQLASGGVAHTILLFTFTLGLFAALITTADSLLLVAAQMLALDLLGLDGPTVAARHQVRNARLILVVVAVASFLVFAVFRSLNLDIVSLVFSIYGAQLALFPATAVALLTEKSGRGRLSSTSAIMSIGGGFAAAWTAALYGRFSGDPNWVFYAPAVALGASTLLLLLFIPFTRRSSSVSTSS